MASNQRAFFILFFQKLGAIQYNTLTRPPGGSLCQQEAGVEQRTGHTAVNVEFITFIEFIDRNKDTKKEKRVRNKRKYTLKENRSTFLGMLLLNPALCLTHLVNGKINVSVDSSDCSAVIS